MIFFTICAKNFLAQALTLRNSLARAYDEVEFYVVLCDELGDIEPANLPFSFLLPEDLGIPSWETMRERYNITELNTAVKPFAFEILFDAHPDKPVIYLDPDIFVISRLRELEQAFADGAACVLTPHILEPAEFAEFDDQKFLQFGVYNLGFCGLRDTPEVRRLVSWWGRRLEGQCVIDLPSGLFVDQKWADLFPAFVPDTFILRHCGYNVAYWNLSQRRVYRADGRWKVNDQNLRFVHFSGHVVGSNTTFARHCATFTRKNIGELAELMRTYESELYENGHAHYKTLPYAFHWDGAGGPNLHTPEGANSGRAGLVPAHMPLTRATSLAEFEATRAAQTDQIENRHATELGLLNGSEETFFVRGQCTLCGRETHFQVGFMYASRHTEDGRLIPNWREHLNCEHCGLVNRVRASLHVLHQELQPKEDASIYVTEALTETYRWLDRRFANVVGSEYLDDETNSGTIKNGIRHENIEALSFERDSFDYVLSFDVLEHVPHDNVAFRELHRCLKPGGWLMFTVPFRADLEENEIRAELKNDGTIEHHTEPEYHGNPVDPEGGSLCYRYFGWSCLSQLEQLGFEDATALNYWSKNFGWLGDPQFIFLARKAR